MSARVLEGASLAESIRGEVRQAVESMSSPPKLVALLATDNGGARFYARSQQEACAEVGIDYELIELPSDASQAQILDRIRQVNEDPSITGAILLTPTPPGTDPRILLRALDPDKDVEGVHPSNVGRLLHGDFSLAPCTPHTVVRLLEYAGVELEGKETVVVGHSETVGKPLVVMLLHSADASPTVTCCHIATRDLAFHTRRAEVLIVAAGKPGLISADMVREGAVVIDVGINRVRTERNGKKVTLVVGDVEFEEVRQKAALITPVPGGVGPVTTAMLLRNVVECARRKG